MSEFYISAELKTGKTFKLRETTFATFKNFCKTFNFTQSPKNIRVGLYTLLEDNLIDTKLNDTNIVDKILLLLKIRSLILGNNVTLKTEFGDSNIDLNAIYAVFDKKINSFQYKRGLFDPGIELHISIHRDFILDAGEALDSANNSIIARSFSKNTISYSADHSLPFKSILEQQQEAYKEFRFSFLLSADKSFDLNLFDASFLNFFKIIFNESYADILEKEYILRKNCNFGTYDFENMPYVECSLMLQKLLKESKEKDKSMNGDPRLIK